jgi:hypothetical protein
MSKLDSIRVPPEYKPRALHVDQPVRWPHSSCYRTDFISHPKRQQTLFSSLDCLLQLHPQFEDCFRDRNETCSSCSKGYYQLHVFDKFKHNETMKLVCRLWFPECKCSWVLMWMETRTWRKKHLLSSLSSFTLCKILPIVRTDRGTAMFVARACMWKGVLPWRTYTTLNNIKIICMHRATLQVVLPRSALVHTTEWLYCLCCLLFCGWCLSCLQEEQAGVVVETDSLWKEALLHFKATGLYSCEIA